MQHICIQQTLRFIACTELIVNKYVITSYNKNITFDHYNNSTGPTYSYTNAINYYYYLKNIIIDCLYSYMLVL